MEKQKIHGMAKVSHWRVAEWRKETVREKRFGVLWATAMGLGLDTGLPRRQSEASSRSVILSAPLYRWENADQRAKGPSEAGQSGAGIKGQAPTTAPHCLSWDASHSRSAREPEARLGQRRGASWMCFASRGPWWGCSWPCLPAQRRSCPDAATRWQQTLCDRAAGRARPGQGAGPRRPPAARPGEQGGLFPPPVRPARSATLSSGVGPDSLPGPRAAVSHGSGTVVLAGLVQAGEAGRASHSYEEGAGAGGGQKAGGQARLAAPPRPAGSHRLLCCSPDPVGGKLSLRLTPEETAAGTRLGPGWGRTGGCWQSGALHRISAPRPKLASTWTAPRAWRWARNDAWSRLVKGGCRPPGASRRHFLSPPEAACSGVEWRQTDGGPGEQWEFALWAMCAGAGGPWVSSICAREAFRLGALGPLGGPWTPQMRNQPGGAAEREPGGWHLLKPFKEAGDSVSQWKLWKPLVRKISDRAMESSPGRSHLGPSTRPARGGRGGAKK